MTRCGRRFFCAHGLFVRTPLPPRAGGRPRQLVLLLHGVGADGDDLIALAPALARRLAGAAFVAPMAPFGYQWFSLRDRRPEALLLGVQSVAPLLDALIDAELEHCRLTDDRLAEEAQSRPPVSDPWRCRPRP